MSQLSQDTLQDILRIQTEGPPMEEYDPSTAVMQWDKAKGRRPNQKPRGVYNPRPPKHVAKELDSSEDLSSSEEYEDTLFRSEEEEMA